MQRRPREHEDERREGEQGQTHVAPAHPGAEVAEAVERCGRHVTERPLAPEIRPLVAIVGRRSGPARALFIMSATYDLMLLLDADAPGERREQILAEVANAISSSGEIVSRHDWGTRSLAYEIRHQNTADYHLIQFTGPVSLLESLHHMLRITDGVVRSRVVKLHPGTPPPPDVRPEVRPAPTEAPAPEAAGTEAPAAATEAPPAAAEAPSEATAAPAAEAPPAEAESAPAAS